MALEPNRFGTCTLCGCHHIKLFATPREWNVSPFVCLSCWSDTAGTKDPEFASAARLFDSVNELLHTFREVVLANQKGGQK